MCIDNMTLIYAHLTVKPWITLLYVYKIYTDTNTKH